MDSLTHLVAGALTPLAFKNTPRRTALICFGIVAGELPDLDVIFGASPQALMTLHRGITHALFWQPVMALLVAVPFFLWLCNNRAEPVLHNGAPLLRPGMAGLDSRGNPAFVRLWFMALIALCLHIYLDCMTSFGTQALLPFSDARVALPAMFIVDPLLTLPALALLVAALKQEPDYARLAGSGNRGRLWSGVMSGTGKENAPGRAPGSGKGQAGGAGQGVALYSRRSRALAKAALAWIVVYPLLALGVNAAATATTGGVWLRPGDPSARLILMTEPFSPFIWKKIESQKQGWLLSLTTPLSGQEAGESIFHKRPDPVLYASLMRQESIFAHFASFAPLMTQTERPAPALTSSGHSGPVREYAFADLRYLAAPSSFTHLVGRGDAMFVLEARVNAHGALLAWRFLKRAGDASHTPWVLLE